MSVGDRIRERRKALDISQVELAEAVRITKQLLYKYENNIITNVPSDKIEAIAKVLDVSPVFLMGWDEKDTKTAMDEINTADVSSRLRDDKDMVQALKVYFKMPPEKKKHVIETIHLIGDKK